jgi:hypothetical protein
MRNNYHNPSHSEDSVTKISRSKSRNQMGIVNKIKEKVDLILNSRQVGTNVFISSIYLNTIIKTNRIPNVSAKIFRSQE